MQALGEFWRRMKFFFRRDEFQRELHEEMQHHLELSARAHTEVGESPDEARFFAQHQLGNALRLREESQDAWAVRWLEELGQDIRYGLRTLCKNRGFAAVAIMTLGLGIGANTAIFSLVESVLLQPVPAKDPTRLVALYTSGPHGAGYSSTSYPDYEYYRDHTKVFSGVMAYARIRVSWTHGGEADFPWTEIVSENYFAVLGVKPFMGQLLLSAAGAGHGAGPAAVVSYEFWQRQLGSDAHALGKPLVLDGHPFVVVGVASKGFSGVNLDWGTKAGIWLPLSMQPQVLPSSIDLLQAREARWLLVIARLAPGVAPADARANVALAAQQLVTSYPAADKDRTAIVLPATQARIWPTWREQIVNFLGLLMGVAGLVLLIACSNVANLLLSRAGVRRKEIATRLALGAGRARVVRQLLTENALLTAAAGAVGAGLALLIMQVFPSFRLPFTINIALHPQLDGRVLGFTLALSVLTVMLFGLVPAAECSNASPNQALKEGGREASTGVHASRMRNGLVVSQVALTLVCTMGAALLLRNLYRVENTDPGFNSHNVLVAAIECFTRNYSEAEQLHFYRRLLGEVRQLPGVNSATLTSGLPLSVLRDVKSVVPYEEEGGDSKHGFQVQVSTVSPAFFETLRIRLLRGRDFSPTDDETSPGVVIVNRTLAHAFWPHQDPVGRYLMIAGEKSYREVIGITEDIKYHTVWESPQPYMYLPLFQSGAPEVYLAVRSAGEPMSLMPAMRRAVSTLDPQVPLYDVGTLDEHFRDALSQPRMAAFLVGFFSLLALALAAVGIYGLVSYSVSQRTHEIGVRMAFGAGEGDMLKMIIKQGLRLSVAGLAIGLVASWALTRLIAGWLYDVKPADPATFFAVSLLLAVVALVATYVPARRASRVDPMVALRYE
ncbi:MAG TPA: ABC transporter permease [Terriglobia bacterium]|nr:ABC transporter permease [Terriglobia bacterium]